MTILGFVLGFILGASFVGFCYQGKKGIISIVAVPIMVLFSCGCELYTWYEKKRN